MSDREELMKVADIWFDETAEKEWPEADTGILADRILQAGFRKTLELGELESFESSEVVKREGPWVHFDDVRRLVAHGQPSAMVNREAIEKAYRDAEEGELVEDPHNASHSIADVITKYLDEKVIR